MSLTTVSNLGTSKRLFHEDRLTDGKLLISTDNERFLLNCSRYFAHRSIRHNIFVRKNQVSSEFMRKIYAASGRLFTDS